MSRKQLESVRVQTPHLQQSFIGNSLTLTFYVAALVFKCYRLCGANENRSLI